MSLKTVSCLLRWVMAGERSVHTAAACSWSGGLWVQLEWSLRNLAGMVSLCSSSPSLDCSFSTFALKLFSLNPLHHLWAVGHGVSTVLQFPQLMGGLGWLRASALLWSWAAQHWGFHAGELQPQYPGQQLHMTPISHPIWPSGKPCNWLLLCEKQLNHSSWATYAPISYYFNTLFSQA